MRLKRRNVEIIECDIEKVRGLIADGFEVIEGEAEVKAAEEKDAENLEALSVKELKALAKAKGITISNALRKQEIIEVLEDYHDGRTED